MKHVYLVFCGLLLAGLVGCTGAGTPGGPGVTTNSSNPVVGTGDDTFTLDTPNLATSIKQNEAKQVSIAIKRGKNFSEDVALKFDNLPQGVSIEPMAPMIKAGQTEAKVTLKANDKAAVGDHMVKVTGKPTKGAEAANEFKITINEK
jgi:uncharacterized membrane protein